MTSKQRLTFASMWAFEDIGASVQEMEDELQRTYPDIDCHCEYSRTEDILAIKGKVEDCTSKVVMVVSSFIEDQKNKDLLDMPRICLLENPSMLQENSPNTPSLGNDEQEDLLALDDHSDDEIAPQPITRVTKFWLSPDGGVGCFASGNFSKFLADIAACTGTNITIIDNLRGIQVSGRGPGDVDDALMKLTRIERPLASLSSPQIANVLMSSNDKPTQLSIESYGNLNAVALRRILVDPNMNSPVALGQMFVTVCRTFDEETGECDIPSHLRNPPRPCKEPEKSRIWNDFTFQELGNGHKFLAMESIVESNSTNTAPLAPGISQSHPYLTAEKVKQVNKWVVERAGLEMNDAHVADGAEVLLSAQPQPQSPSKTTLVISSGAPAKRPPGIKERRAVLSSPKTGARSPKLPTTETGSSNSYAEGREDTTAPRKRWTMNYGPELNGLDTGISTNIAENSRLGNMFEFHSGYSTFVYPATPEGRTRLPKTFDVTKYGHNKPSYQVASSGNNLKSTDQPKQLKKGAGIRKELIDVFTPIINTNNSTHPPLSLKQPALIPGRPPANTQYAEGERSENRGVFDSDKSVDDLAGLKFETTINSCIPYSDSSSQETRSSASAGAEDRLRLLKNMFHKSLDETGSTHKPQNHPAKMNKMLEAQVLAELERVHKSEGIQTVDELQLREYHYTMNQRTSRDNNKAKEKAKSRAKRQATLEDAWGRPNSSRKKPEDTPKPHNRPSSDGVKEKLSTTEKEGKYYRADPNTNLYIKQVFEAIKPTLEAAEVFPGVLNLELQIGLVLIPLLPKTCIEGLMSPNEWSGVFQPRSGLAAPSTKFINRLTTSGSDVDHILDLKTSKAEGNRRIFEQDYSEYCISYEYHCQTKTGQPLIITINEDGKYSIQKPSSVLGAVNLHFPERIWDARAVVSGTTDYQLGTNPEFEEAAQYLADNIWVQPGKSLVRIFSCLPKGNKIIVDKVFMKRWTRHRHVRYDDDLGSRNEISPKPQSSSTREIESNDNQDTFLQIREVQELFIGTSDSTDDQPIRARSTSLTDMIQKGKLWYEVSLVSSTIEAILKSNISLEVGERTEDWRGIDLLGRDICPEHDHPALSSVSPVAAAIRAAGLGDLLCLAKAVVGKIDGVGYWNYISTSEASQVVAAHSFDNMLEALPNQPVAPSFLGLPANRATKGYDFDEIESVKEVESIRGNVVQSPPEAWIRATEKFEQDYW